MQEINDDFWKSNNMLDQVAGLPSSGDFNTEAQISSFRTMFRKVARTPRLLCRLMNAEFGFKLFIDGHQDPTVFNEVRRVEWKDATFVIPSTKNTDRWLKKAIEECGKGRLTCLLVPSSTNTAWFHDMILTHPSCEVRFVRGRLQFPGYDKQSRYPSALAIYWPEGRRPGDHRVATLGESEAPGVSIMASFTDVSVRANAKNNGPGEVDNATEEQHGKSSSQEEGSRKEGDKEGGGEGEDEEEDEEMRQ